MKIKPNFQLYILPLVLFTCFTLSCGKKHTVVPENNEKSVTAGKVTNLVSYPGKNRIKLSWKLSANADVQKIQLNWGIENKEAKEVLPAKGENQMEVVLDGLPEGEYTFSVAAIDAKGSRSEVSTVKGNVYGSKYEAGLVDRAVNEVIFNDVAKTLTINWGSIGPEMSGMELSYTDAANSLQTVSVSRFSDQTILSNFKPGSTFEYRTIFQLPGGIDDFYTAFKTVEVDQVVPYLGADWVLYTPVKKIHMDNEEGLQTYSWTNYKSVCSPVICAEYSYNSSNLTETFQILNSKSNRSEIRVEDNYATGSRQFSGYVKFDAPLNDESLMQIFGSTSENATQLMIRGFSENGGTLKISTSYVLATGIYNKEIHINVIHLQEDAGNRMIVYIDGEKKFEKVDGENATNYFKYGCYGTMKTGKAIVQWRDVKFYKNGKEPAGK